MPRTTTLKLGLERIVRGGTGGSTGQAAGEGSAPIGMGLTLAISRPVARTIRPRAVSPRHDGTSARPRHASECASGSTRHYNLAMSLGEKPRPKRRGSWRRRLAWALLVAVLVAVAIPAAILGSLHLESVRDVVIARTSKRFERSVGTVIRAQDFDLDPWNGVIELRGLEVASAGVGHEPFLTAARVRAELDLGSLLGGNAILRDLRVEEPRLALGAPLPSVPSRESAKSAETGFGFEIRSFDIRGGEIDALGSRYPAAAWLEGFRLSDLAAHGSFVGGRVTAVVSHAGLLVKLRARPYDLDLEGAIAIATDGAFEVRALEARGAGLTLGARGAGRIGPTVRFEASYEFQADLARLAPDLVPRGSLAVSGSVELGGEGGAGPRGVVRIEARGVPVDAAERFVPVELPPTLALRGTEVDVAGDLEFDLTSARSAADLRADAIRGEASLVWRRGGTRLLDARARSEPEAPRAAAGSARCSVRAALFPESEGERRLQGTATLRSWADPRSVNIESARLRVIEPHVPAGLDRLGIRVPWQDRPVPGGSLEATVEAAGPLAGPRLRIDATWRDREETLATLSGSSPPGWRGWQSGLALDLRASLLPGMPGTRRANAQLLGLDLRDGIVRVDLPDLAAAVEDLGRRAGVALPSGARPLDEMLAGPFEGEARVFGPVTGPRVVLDAIWHPNGQGSIRLFASGRPTGDAPFLDLAENVTLEARDVDGASFGAPGLFVQALEASSDGKSVAVEKIAATLPPAAHGIPPGEISGSGRFDLAWPPRQADADLAIEHPLDGIDRATVHVRLDGGVVHLDPLDVRSGASGALVRAAIPLAALARFAGPLRETLAGYDSGPISLQAEGIDLRALQPLLPLPSAFPAVSGTVSVRGMLDTDHLLSSSGSIEAQGFALDLDGRRVEAEGPIRIDLRDGSVVLAPTPLRATGPNDPGGQGVEISGTLDLARDWTLERDLPSLIGDFSFDLHGSVEAATFVRFLGSGTASGSVAVEATARGPLSAATADIHVSGPDARISFLSPYATRFESPEARIRVRDGTLEIESAQARWNGGDVEIRGTIGRGEARLETDFRGTTYRLDYGATARIGGQLELIWPAEGERTLQGSLNIERATLRRNVALDREVLRSVLEPEVTADNPVLESIRLDLQLTTSQGLKIKNNLADLHAEWDPLEVTGSLASPKISGQARVTPGGLLNLLGSIVRIDEATLSWSGDPPASPRIAMKTTSSIEDPTIKNQWYHSWYQVPVLGPGRGGAMDLTAQRASSEEVMDAFAAGVMAYYQERVAGAVSGGATQTELSYQPLTLFGETDTTARTTLTQHLSRYATFIASNNPIETEAQTFILDVHGLDAVPSLTAQFFRNDAKNTGATLQQTVRLGKGLDDDETADRLRKVRIDAPKGVSKRRLRKAISYRPGDPIPEGSELDVELDVVDAMRRAGYPLAEMSVKTAPHERRGVDLMIRVVPGWKIENRFEGDRPRASARRAIAALYRPGEEETASLEEIRQETIRALRFRGHLEPQVEVWVDRGDASDAAALLTVRVRAEGGRKVDPDAPRFLGVPPDEASALSSLCATPLTRISLAAAEPTADRRVVRALAAVGYPDAHVVSRELSANGRDLVVRVEPGDRQRFARVAITGLTPEDEARLEPLLEAREGEPVIADRVARSILAIEKEMRRTGHAQVDVQARLEPVSAERPLERALTLEVTPGPTFEIDDVRYRGSRASKPGWIHGVADLTAGTPVDPQEISKARARLARTGVFQEIRVSTDPPTDSSARTSTAVEADRPIPTEIRFDLTERKRWQLAYGGRYESNVGFGVVTDLYNFNSLGRGHTSGFRTIYSENEKRVQLYHVVPRAFGERSSLEGLAEWKKELVEGVWSEGEQAWAQITLPLSKRWQNRAYVEFERRDLTAESPDPDDPLDQRAISPRLGWQLMYDSRVFPSAGAGRAKGFFYGLNLIGSSEWLGSDLTGLGTFQQWSHFLPLGDRERGRLSWAHSYRVNTANVKDASLPFDNRLRAGGEFSVRGYPTNSLGPQDDQGEALGGEVLFITNQEMHVRLGRTFSGMLFLDAGNVWPTLHDVGWHLSASYGLGLRWSSPVGPLRLDWAIPLDRRPGDSSSTIYFGFGNVF